VWYDIKADDWTTENGHMVALRGDMVVLDIERYWRTTDGAVMSFFSVKNLDGDAGEIRCWVGGHLLDYDLPTLSFAFEVVQVTEYTRTLQPRVGYPGGGAPVNLPYTVLHPVVYITTHNKFRRALYPDTIPDSVKAIVTPAACAADPRHYVADLGLTFMPLNDPRNWSDPEIANLRNYYCEGVFHYKTGTGYTTPTPELFNWWGFAMQGYFVPTPLLSIDHPRFGWYVYADEIMNRMWVSPDSTFFVHPDGTWAFFDDKHIYNKHGMYGPMSGHDALTPFLEDANALEHVIFDAVHIQSRGRVANTTFVELYNKAVQKGEADGTLLESFELLTKDLLRVNFIKEIHTQPDGVKWLDLHIQWYGAPATYNGWYPETGYQGGAYSASVLGYVGTGGLLDYTLAGVFYTAPGYGGYQNSVFGGHRPVRFSTCLLIQ
jgi:hypothetical protein